MQDLWIIIVCGMLKEREGCLMKKSWMVSILLLAGCVAVPAGVEPVADFSLERYLGKWYEIARLDHSFERGLSRVTAEYSLREDGGVRVLNRGYSEKGRAWKEAEGRGYFVKGTSTPTPWSAGPAGRTCGSWRDPRTWTRRPGTGWWHGQGTSASTRTG